MKRSFILKFILFPISIICTPFLQIEAQSNYTLKGKVMSESGEPILNANILISGSNLGISSNGEGNFALKNLPGENINLTISHVAYDTLRIIINPAKNSEKNLILKEKNYEISEVVVTGTMTQKKLKDTPVRTELISKDEIKNMGFMKLADALAQQTGLTLVHDVHGTGVQVQGLSSDYTLILIDGEPAIGRTTGILELSRFDVANLKQIEIVKGPSSSLYGSEALAGVINLITDVPSKPLEANFKSTYGTYNTINAAGNAQFIHKNLSGTFYFGFNSSDGYKLNQKSISQTAPLYKTYTINPKLEYKINDNSSIGFSWRTYIENQKNIVQINENNQNFLLDENNDLTDWNGTISFNNNFSSFKTTAKFYAARYLSKSALNYKEDNTTYSVTDFDQFLYKGDLYSNYTLNNENLSTFGVGFELGSVEANYISGGSKKTDSYYAFLQHEWIPSDIFDFVAGVRFDNPKDYASRLSPKFSVKITPIKSLIVRASAGSGYKSPDLKQLYLNFTNPQVGYTVFGAANAKESFATLQSEGQIERILMNPSQMGKIKAENSITFNLGLDYSPYEFLSLSVNLFRNNVQDLIESAAIATKKNGQSVFTYFNLNKIFTQGVEAELTINPFDDFAISAGYQFLEAEDVDVINKIKAGEISTVTSSGHASKLTLSNYGGLFNRSRNSGTIKINYKNKPLGLNANLIGILRGKYGFSDINGNGVLDDEREYVQGYAIWNLIITKSITENIDAQIRIENLFGKTNHEFIPSLPGRIFYASISFGFSNY